MKKVIAAMHISLDGFVGGPNGEMDWITLNDEMFDYVATLTQNADTALYGRVTYEMMNGYWPTAGDQPKASKHDIEHSAWYNSVTKIILSSSMKGLKTDNLIVLSDDMPEKMKKIKEQGGKDILIFGSPTACHSLMQHDLIDEFWLYINPVLLGKGIPFFNYSDRHKLNLVSTKNFDSGVVCLNYERTR